MSLLNFIEIYGSVYEEWKISLTKIIQYNQTCWNLEQGHIGTLLLKMIQSRMCIIDISFRIMQ